jgi:phosphoribulokinase
VTHCIKEVENKYNKHGKKQHSDYLHHHIKIAGNEHYTAIIILHQQNRLLFYDNLHGINVIDTIHQGPASDVLSLIYLLRDK